MYQHSLWEGAPQGLEIKGRRDKGTQVETGRHKTTAGEQNNTRNKAPALSFGRSKEARKENSRYGGAV